VLAGVFEAEPVPIPLATLQAGFDTLVDGIIAHDEDRVRSLVFKMLKMPEKVESLRPVAATRRVVEALPASAKYGFVNALTSKVAAKQAV
jgi:hypothetical protein